MNVKKKYNVGDTVWIYGISRTNEKSTQGTVIKSFVIDYKGFNNEPHYVIGIPTEIDMLLEIRTWHSISQTKDGNVGSIREAFEDPDAARKWLGKIGINLASVDEVQNEALDEDGPSSDEIRAALEKSEKDGSHGPLIIKDPKRKYYSRKRKL